MIRVPSSKVFGPFGELSYVQEGSSRPQPSLEYELGGLQVERQICRVEASDMSLARMRAVWLDSLS